MLTPTLRATSLFEEYQRFMERRLASMQTAAQARDHMSIITNRIGALQLQIETRLDKTLTSSKDHGTISRIADRFQAMKNRLGAGFEPVQASSQVLNSTAGEEIGRLGHCLETGLDNLQKSLHTRDSLSPEALDRIVRSVTPAPLL